MKKDNMQQTDGEDILFQEINEEMKRERIKNFWKKYGLLATIILVAAITFAVSFESIKAWQGKKAATWSDAYAYAFNLQAQGRYDESINVFKNIENENHGIYKNLAQMQVANILLEQGKTEEAVKSLEEMAEDDSFNPNLHDVAVIKLVSYKLDNAPAAEIESLLNPLIAANGSWVNIAKEMKAMLAIREENLELAKEIYNDILSDEKLPDSMKARVEDMLSVLNETQANSTK